MGMVDDDAQDTLIAFHQKRQTSEQTRPFKTWLAAIARYKWIVRLRAPGRNATVSLDEEPAETSSSDHGLSVTGALLPKILMASLKPGHSQAIRPVRLHGHGVEDRPAAAGQSVSLVKINIHRGLARMAAMIGLPAGAS